MPKNSVDRTLAIQRTAQSYPNRKQMEWTQCVGLEK